MIDTVGSIHWIDVCSRFIYSRKS